ncbi:MAG: hypothetical protein JWO77_1708 [Ilumatobacteraceae bacterium]|nr:hypothetical protein [Ilumatobacteraceae bacterium]
MGPHRLELVVTDLATSPESTIADLPGGPFDIEFFFDPGCPFAWQTSVWIRRVMELRGISVGWRFISLKFINEDRDEQYPGARAAQLRGLRYHRICAAAREQFGNEAVAKLYRAWGEAYWNTEATGDRAQKFEAAAANAVPADLLASVDLPASLLDAADDESWDALIRAESDEAFRRTGEDVGTPIITYLPSGHSLFGPVISSIPDDETSLAFYDALRVFADFPDFSELKRTKRAPLDLPLFG